MKEFLDFIFRPACDDNFEPGSMCGCLSQNLQEDRAILGVTTFVERVNDKDESVLWVEREVADEVKEESVLHRLCCQIWITAKTICHEASKGGKDFGEFGDEGWKDVSELVHIRVIPLAEKCSGEPLCTVKLFTN